MIRRSLLILAIATLATFFSQKVTDGFTVGKLGEVFLDESPVKFDESFLTQEYHYWGKGGQSYVFLSEDGQYILKFFRGSKLKNLSLPPRTAQRLRKYLDQQAKMRQTLQSYAIAHRLLKEESGIVAVHLSPTDSLTSELTLVDRSMIRHRLNANRYPFVIQKRADLVKQTISQLMDRGEIASAKIALKSLFSLIEKQRELGIADNDPNLVKNFGFIGSKPIQIDGGSFSLGVSLSNDRLSHSKEDLQNWINRYYPELSEDFKKVYEDFLTKTIR